MSNILRHKLFFLPLLMQAMVSVSQVVPNQGFENWTNAGPYEMPDYWDNLNPTTVSGSVFTCTMGTPGYPGQSFLELTSRTVTGMGVVPGVAVCGILDQTTRQPVSGFPLNLRPERLTGNWQYMMYGTGKGFIDVTLTKWSPVSLSREIIASNHTILSGMEMSWKAFSLKLQYNSPDNPDSCILFLSASGNIPANYDYLYVDDLAFLGNIPNGIENENSSPMNVTIYPDPADDYIRLSLPGSIPGNLAIEIFNTTGQPVLYQPLATPIASISTRHLPNGIYSYTISGRNKTVLNSGRIIVLHK